MTPTRKKALGDRLRAARRHCDLSQDEVAELLGVKRQTVSAWETGVTVPTAFQVADLAAAYCLSAHYLLFGVHYERIDVKGLLPGIGQDEPAAMHVPPCADGQSAPSLAGHSDVQRRLGDGVEDGSRRLPIAWLGSILGRAGTP